MATHHSKVKKVIQKGSQPLSKGIEKAKGRALSEMRKNIERNALPFAFSLSFDRAGAPSLLVLGTVVWPMMTRGLI